MHELRVENSLTFKQISNSSHQDKTEGQWMPFGFFNFLILHFIVLHKRQLS